MKADAATQPPPAGARQDPHRLLRSQTGALPGEHPGRSRNPLVKVAGLAWLEFEKPDLHRAERFGTDFGFTVADRTPDAVLLRGWQAGTACQVVRRGPRPCFAGAAFHAAARDDLDRLARGTGCTVTAHRGGYSVTLRGPHGQPGAYRPGPARPGSGSRRLAGAAALEHPAGTSREPSRTIPIPRTSSIPCPGR